MNKKLKSLLITIEAILAAISVIKYSCEQKYRQEPRTKKDPIAVVVYDSVQVVIESLDYARNILSKDLDKLSKKDLDTASNRLLRIKSLLKNINKEKLDYLTSNLMINVPDNEIAESINAIINQLQDEIINRRADLDRYLRKKLDHYSGKKA